MPPTPEIRIRPGNDRPLRPGGEFVLYWMIAARRPGWNFGLQRAIEQAVTLGRPLVILEGLRIGYPWASDRIHRFILDGMADHKRLFAGKPVLYYPYVEPTADADKNLLASLAAMACLVVSDDFPAFFLPQMVASAAGKLPVRLELVDANGLLPLRAADHAFTTAHSFRRFLQKTLRPHLSAFPEADPFAGVSLPRLQTLPSDITTRWPEAAPEVLEGGAAALQSLAIDHAVSPTALRGGPLAGRDRLGDFLDRRLARYPEDRNHPDADGSSGLSPYLHFGHVSAHQVFAELMLRQDWSLAHLATKATGSREGWWGAPAPAESFLDELITWRELGFNFCWQRPMDYDRYDSLPDWARATLAAHAADPRAHVYSLTDFEQARTHDPLWNAAQRQLVREGRIHNYLRMLWGKKILEWTAKPQDALAAMIELNNKYALDGRDPNSYSGIFWVLGRYDRAWGPERPIFGKVRYMSSDNTARKVKLKGYLRAFGP